MLSRIWNNLVLWQKVAAALVAGYILLSLLVLWVISPWVRAPIAQAIQDATGRPVQLASVALNPLNWSLRVKGFALQDPDGQSLVAFDEFYVNFQLSSLFRRSWHFDSIQLHGPRVRVVQTGAGTFNLDDLLGSDGEQEQPQDTPAALTIPAVSFREFVLSEGDFRFCDQSRPEPKELVLAPLTFGVRDFSTRSDGEGSNFYEFRVEGPGGGRLEWAGSVAVEPLVLQGEMALQRVDLTPFADFVQDQLNFSLSSALLDIRGRYRFAQENNNLFELEQGEVRLSQLNIHERGQQGSAPVISLPTLDVTGVALSTATSRVDVARVLVDGLAVTLAREPATVDTAFATNLERLFTPLAVAPVAPVDVQAGDTVVAVPTQVTEAVELAEERLAERVEQGWYGVVETLELRDATLSLWDHTLNGAANDDDQPPLKMDPINATVRHLDSRGDTPLDVELSLALQGGGELTVAGQAQWAPLQVSAESRIVGLNLALANPWISDQLNARLAAGQLESELSLTATAQGESLAAQVHGQTAISGFTLQEGDGAPVLGFERLALEDWALDADTLAFSARRLLLSGLEGRMTVDAQGRDLLARLQPPSASPAVASSPAATPGPLPVVNLQQVVLQGANLSYEDHSLNPPFRISLNEVGAELRGLNSASRTPGTLRLQGQVDRLTPLQVNGQLGVPGFEPEVDLTVALDGYEMTRLTPFTGQFLGFGVDSGQLSVGSRIRIQRQQLDSSSEVKADQFFLGDAVPSEEALKVPIKLGLAILRDRNGVIALPVNASGDLNDPAVSVTGILLRTLRNILVRAATSPFSLLTGLAGDADHQQVRFEPGSIELAAPEQQVLDALGKALLERPSLILRLAGDAGGDDRRALAEAELRQRLGLAAGQPVADALTERKLQRQVNRLFEQELGGDLGQWLDESLPSREQRQQQQSLGAWAALQEHWAQRLPAQSLSTLAQQRAEQVKRYLVEQQQVPADRVVVVARPSLGDVPAVALELGAR